MDLWLTAIIAVAVAIVVTTVRALILRAARRRRPRLVEKPNSHYTPQLVLDRDAIDRWFAIPLERVHEINRGEIQRLLERVSALGIDALHKRERDFLERMAELNPPPPDRPPRSPRTDDRLWSDPFGFDRRLQTPDING